MVEGMISVQDTDYKDYFENVGRDTVFLLSRQLAESEWNQRICEGASSYFNLPNDCWVIANKSTFIGQWIEAYNDDNNSILEETLRKELDWSDSAIVNFFAKRKIVFQTTWGIFLRHWDSFIAIEDDCPILLPEEGLGKMALVFTPLGDVLKIRSEKK